MWAGSYGALPWVVGFGGNSHPLGGIDPTARAVRWLDTSPAGSSQTFRSSSPAFRPHATVKPPARALPAWQMRARVVAPGTALRDASRWRDKDASQVRGGRRLPGCPRPRRLPRRLRDARAAAFRDGLPGGAAAVR